MAMATWQVNRVFTAFLLVHFNGLRHCSSQPVPVTLPLNRFGTKTTYNASQTRMSEDTTFDDSSNSETQSCYKPAQAVILSRHGIRYPGKKDLRNIEIILSDFRTHGLAADVYKQLHSVIDRMPVSEASMLAPTGAQEQFDLGRRFARRFPSVFRRPDEMLFTSSLIPRTLDSRRSFVSGFYEALGWNSSTLVHNETRNDLIRFFDDCPRYTAEVEDNKTAFAECYKFQDLLFDDIARKIAVRLNLTDLKIKKDVLYSLYNTAAVEVATFGTRNWAKLLDEDDIAVLEYSADLKQYYKLGYGYPINYEMSCPLIADIFQHMDSFINGTSDRKKGVFYFGHAETIVPVFAALGLFRDPFPLRADYFRDNRTEIADRKFCTSRMASFSVNVAFVLHECSGNGRGECTEGHCDRYMLQLLINERPAKFPFCAERALCSYDAVRREYARYIDGCDFNRTCSLRNSGSGNHSGDEL